MLRALARFEQYLNRRFSQVGIPFLVPFKSRNFY